MSEDAESENSSAAAAAPIERNMLALPWRKSNKSDNEWLDDYSLGFPGSYVYRFIIDANCELVGVAYAEGVHDEASEDLNRRVALMVTAGDLLAACKRVMQLAASAGNDEIFAEVRAAIAKATS